MSQRSLSRNLLVVALIVGAMGAQSDSFRWVDEQGVTHYSDQVPPDQAGRQRAVISPQGQEVKVIEAPKTAEQLRRELQLKQLRAQQEKVIGEQRDQDLALIRTYRSSDEMYAALKAKLDTLDGIIRITEANRLRQKELLAEQEREAAGTEREGQALSQKQREMIEAIRRQIANYDDKITSIRADKENLVERFQKDIARFKTLQESRKANQSEIGIYSVGTVTADRYAQDEVSAIACQAGPNCQQAWELARDYVVQRSRSGLQMDTERVVQTVTPATDNDFGLTLTRHGGKKEQVIFLDVRCRPTTGGEQLCASSQVREIRGSFRTFVEAGVGAAAKPGAAPLPPPGRGNLGTGRR